MSATLQIQGLKELEDQLLQLGQVAALKAARAAARKSLEGVLADAKRLVPKRTGSLYDSLAITTKRPGKTRGTLSRAIAVAGLQIRKVKAGSVGTRGAKGAGETADPRRYWHLVEFGTSKTPPRPFIRPAFDGRLDDMLGRLKEQLTKRIESARRRALREEVG